MNKNTKQNLRILLMGLCVFGGILVFSILFLNEDLSGKEVSCYDNKGSKIIGANCISEETAHITDLGWTLFGSGMAIILTTTITAAYIKE